MSEMSRARPTMIAAVASHEASGVFGSKMLIYGGTPAACCCAAYT